MCLWLILFDNVHQIKGAYTGGWLSALDSASGECWQANQHGQVRKSEYWSLPNLEREENEQE